MATFEEKLLPASFRGVPFNATASTLTIGRRTHVFEYPQRDKPFVEDLGKSAREITLTAVFAGPEYITGMNRLLEAMEQEGSGVLVHPMLGSMTVTPKATTKVTYSTTKLGFSSAELVFVESGDYVFPTSSNDTAAVSASASETLKQSALDAFLDKFDLSGAQDFVKAAVTGNLSKFFELSDYKELCRLFSVSDEMSELSAKAISLVSSDVEVFAKTVADAFGYSRLAYSVNNWRRVTRLLSRLVRSDGMNNDYQTGQVSDEEARTTAQSSTLQSLARQTLLAEAVSASAKVGGDEDTAEGGIAYEDMIAIRDQVLAALDAEMLETESDDVYLALENARAAVSDDMTTRAQDSARLITVTPPEVQPALVVAYNFYEDAAREKEIIDRNGIRHGGFVPARELKLLSR